MSAAELNAGLLDAFSDALWLEDGLSRNTLESYRSDLEQFGAWLTKHKAPGQWSHHGNPFRSAGLYCI